MEPAQYEPGPSPVAAPDDRISDFRAARRVIERRLRPLASSVDGRRFEFQASLDDLVLLSTQRFGTRTAEEGGADVPTSWAAFR